MTSFSDEYLRFLGIAFIFLAFFLGNYAWGEDFEDKNDDE